MSPTLRMLTHIVALAMLIFASACGGTEPEGEFDTIDADQFIDTYVELRVTSLLSPDGELTPEGRDSVLTARGVKSEDMYEFAQIHGRRAQYMQAVWDSVEVRFNRRRDEVNRASAGATGTP